MTPPANGRVRDEEGVDGGASRRGPLGQSLALGAGSLEPVAAGRTVIRAAGGLRGSS